MPFRTREPWRFQWLILPAFTVLSLSMVVLWLWFCFDAVGGWRRSTEGERLLIFGFAGIPIFIILGVCVTVYLAQSAAYGNYAAILRQLQTLQAHTEGEKP